MKDKEKQIEEIAEILREECFYDLKEVSVETSERLATKLLKHYQPKLPEDSVVLSKDNYNRLKRDSDLFEELLKKKVHLETVIELSNAQYEKVLEENKSLERLISLIDDLPKENLLDLDKWLEAIKTKERKETAEKIYRMADEICTGSQNDGDKILAMIKDTFGAEIKE